MTGRPPAGLAMREIFREFMEGVDRKARKPRIIALCEHLYQTAMAGRQAQHVTAARTLMEYSLSKPAQEITVSGYKAKAYRDFGPEDKWPGEGEVVDDD